MNFLGFAGVVEGLVISGRQIEGVNLAYAFELTDRFSPVPLLKAYLRRLGRCLRSKLEACLQVPRWVVICYLGKHFVSIFPSCLLACKFTL